jgi:hypothetical protein
MCVNDGMRLHKNVACFLVLDVFVMVALLGLASIRHDDWRSAWMSHDLQSSRHWVPKYCGMRTIRTLDLRCKEEAGG